MDREGFREKKLPRNPRTPLSGVTFHQLRHTASTVLSSRVSLATAKKVLGYADIKTTLKYTHPEIEERKKGDAKMVTNIIA